ncbi:hypothetical protein J2S43_003026 [Catenuloplanes nepalensis]|uniref:Uncharacterized protein n=1 Tax=Catenuloplanes nepalensis TaxID=587533 RepID=A0ABT9MSU6_9ACTN|nr:hypothetical protein [Catenuloplanes nepalensis]MDP9794514.1 hypothetical protein [Catenuloplanes nepalensis]
MATAAPTCPVCAGLSGRGRALFDRLPLRASCAEHGCRLEDTATVSPAAGPATPNSV